MARKISAQTKIKTIANEWKNGTRSGDEALLALDGVVATTNDWAALMQAGALRRRINGEAEEQANG